MKRILAPALAILVASFAGDARADEAPASRPRASIARELAISIAATTLLSPAIYGGASLVGGATPNLTTSLVPAMLFAAAAPPAVATAGVLYARSRDGAPGKILPTYFFPLIAQVAVLVGAAYAKTYVREAKDLVLLSVATGAANGAAATLGAELAF